MLTFIVLRAYGPAWDESKPMRAQSGWDEHARFMEQLLAEGFVRLGGPLDHTRQILLVVEAEDDTAITHTLERDPWHSAGLLTTARITPWTILLDAQSRPHTPSA